MFIFFLFCSMCSGPYANSKNFNLISTKISTKIILKKSIFQNFFIDFIATTCSVASILPALNFHKHVQNLVKNCHQIQSRNVKFHKMS